MRLTTVKQAPLGQLARGLSPEALASCTVRIGELTLGHYFGIPSRTGVVWRWQIHFPGTDTSGCAEDEQEAKAVFRRFYADLLRRTGLVDTSAPPMIWPLEVANDTGIVLQPAGE